MMKYKIFVLLVLVSTCISCRMVDTLVGSGKAGTVGSLWPDVPALAGATRTDLSLPLAARLAIRAAMDGKVNFIAFTTGMTPRDIQTFYSKDRMKSAGWNESAKGCVGDTDEKDTQGAMCFFDRKDASSHEGLAIVLAQDDKTKQTDVFYVRIDLTDDAKKP